ncbi:MAG: hypothetical protein ACRDFT_03615 [bacterium]
MAPVADVLLHEDADLARVERLAVRLREDGVLRNPPVAAALPGRGYVVLDGANRTTALAFLGASVLPIQVVEYADVRLDVWSHFILDGGAVPSRLQALGIPLRVADRGADVVPERTSPTCYIATGDDIYEIDVAGRTAAMLSGVVGTYKGTVRIYRVPGFGPGQGLREQSDRLAHEYGAHGTLIVFPMLTKDDILAIARGDEKLPTGVTRHVIAGRALRVDVPLDVLTSEGPLAVKDAWLADYVRGKLLDNRVRYYPEATFLFDE